MKVLSEYILEVDTRDGYHAPCFAHYCPACKHMHAFAVTTPFKNGARWTYNGSIRKPTFEPSMNITCGPFPGDNHIERCHYFLRNGVLEFLPDCTHEMRGQTVELPPFPEEKLKSYQMTERMQGKT